MARSATPNSIPAGFGEILGEMGCFEHCTSVQVVDLLVAGGGFEPPPLGYEDNNQLARLCLFNRLAAGVSWCLFLVFGVLFAECSYICSHFPAQRTLSCAQRWVGSRCPDSTLRLRRSPDAALTGSQILNRKGSVLSREKAESLRLLDEVERGGQCLGVGGVVWHAGNVE
jgi:hypothetical protein